MKKGKIVAKVNFKESNWKNFSINIKMKGLLTKLELFIIFKLRSFNKKKKSVRRNNQNNFVGRHYIACGFFKI